jgi:hypothetical protein
MNNPSSTANFLTLYLNITRPPGNVVALRRIDPPTPLLICPVSPVPASEPPEVISPTLLGLVLTRLWRCPWAALAKVLGKGEPPQMGRRIGCRARHLGEARLAALIRKSRSQTKTHPRIIDYRLGWCRHRNCSHKLCRPLTVHRVEHWLPLWGRLTVT